jgi:hypothetical protein
MQAVWAQSLLRDPYRVASTLARSTSSAMLSIPMAHSNLDANLPCHNPLIVEGQLLLPHHEPLLAEGQSLLPREELLL